MRKAMLPLLLVLAVASAACFQITFPVAPGGEPPTTVPGAGRGPAYVDSVEFLFLESWPVQVRAIIKGALPTPCHTLAWDLAGPDASGRIVLDLYTTSEADVICIQMLESFEQTIDLGSYTGGSYVLVVGGEEYPFTI